MRKGFDKKDLQHTEWVTVQAGQPACIVNLYQASKYVKHEENELEMDIASENTHREILASTVYIAYTIAMREAVLDMKGAAMNWNAFGIVITIAIYAVCIFLVAPYLARRGKRSAVRREENRRLLEHMKTTTVVFIGVLLFNAVIFLPPAIVDDQKQTLTLLGVAEVSGTIVLLLLLRYVSRYANSLDDPS